MLQSIRAVSYQGKCLLTGEEFARGRRILIYVHETDNVRLRNIWDCIEKRDENGLENWFNATACCTMFELELFQTWVVSSKCGSNATRLLLDTSVINTHAEVKRKMVGDFSCMFSFVKKCFTSNFLQKLSKRHALGHPPVVGGSTFISGD